MGKRIASLRPVPLATALVFGLTAAPGCNPTVFETIDPCESEEPTPVVSIPRAKADVLLVIDNSRSMCEEQDNLVENFLDPNCRIQDLSHVPEELQNPDDALLAELSAECGFIQILAAYDNDFRVGVITTDVGTCDNRFDLASNPGAGDCGGDVIEDWGRRPQRGCLQAPQSASKKFIQRGDENVGETFRQTLDGIQIFGSGFERGLDAAQVFLSPDASRAPGCDGDLDSFVREDAALVVIFLTDEDDCSHEVSDRFPDELANQICEEGVQETYEPNLNPPIEYSWCYDRADELKPVAPYADFLREYKGPGRENDVRVAVIAGGMPIGIDDNGRKQIDPVGCYIESAGANAGNPASDCYAPHGGDRMVQVNGEVLCDDGAGNVAQCCIADSGSRYYALADNMPAGNAMKDSICFDSFRDTMVKMALFVAQTDVIILEREPRSPAAIEVEMSRDGDESVAVPRIEDGVEPGPDANGWQYTPADGDTPGRVTFYGDWVPEPGDEVLLFQAVAGSDAECIAATAD